MKKGLLSILAGALVVVGCQNYDDQFDNLESQISALASTVAGLSQVQSDLSALAGTVSSLASTVNGLGDAIDTAVADGLSDIQADIDAIEAAVADVASSEEVSALSDAVADAQTDLTDLLEASSVFTGNVVVNSVNTLDAFHKMGAALNIVNGNVTITVSTEMDQAKVQELVNNILTVVEDFTYTSAASSIAETTFENLTGVQSITITQGGGIRFPNLTSATNIVMKDDFESTVEVIHFGSLTSVSNFYTDSTEDTIEFTKATELHLTSLAYYPGAALTITTDEGAAMPFALDDIDADGDTLEDGLTLTITGPASFSTDKIADGVFDFTDVASVNLTDFKGSVTIGGDVESFTSNSLVSLTVDAGTKIETVDVTGVANPDATTAAPSYGPTISLDTLGDLETVTIAGIATSVNLDSNNNLTSATISADVAGSITIASNSDLTDVTLTGAKATALDVDTNADLTSLTVDLTWRKGTATTAKLDGDLDVTDNASLESLTVSSNNLENLEVTGNDELTTIDFTGVDAIGATGTAVVNIYDNDLTATKLTNTDDGATNVADGATGDKGSITSTSGMDTLSDYLTAVAADTDSAAAVYFDTVESYIDEDDSETTDVVYSSPTAQNAGTVLLLVANTAAAAKDARKAKLAFLANSIAANDVLNITISSTDITAGSTANIYSGVTGNGSNYIKMSGNRDLDIAKIKDAAHVANATALQITLDAKKGGTATTSLTFNVITSATTSNVLAGERYTTAQLGTPATGLISELGGLGSGTTTITADTWWLGSDDYVTVTFGSNTVTATTLSGNTKNATALASAVQAAFVAKYGTAGWASASAIASISVSTGNVIFTSLTKDSSATGLDLSASVTTGSSATTTGKSIEYTIGETLSTAESDNESLSVETIITLESDVAGLILDKVSALTASIFNTSAAASVMVNAAGTLTTTKLLNDDDPKNGLRTANTEARADTRLPEGGVAAAASNGVSFSRIAWL